MIKINFLGDSITEGAAATSLEKTYVYLVGKELNAEARNYGKSATRIAKQIVPSIDSSFDLYFLLRARNMNHDADYMFVFGGVNDFGHGDAPLGELCDKTSETFCGAVEELCKFLLEKYPSNRIVFIPPLHVGHELNPYGDGSKKVPGKNLFEYRDALITIVKRNGIRILDLIDVIGPAKDNPNFVPDALHPSNEGHALIAKSIVEFIKSDLQ